MKKCILQHIKEIVNRYRTWIKADYTGKQMSLHVIDGGIIKIVYGESIALYAYKPHNGYPAGQRWKVHEYELDETITRLTLTDRILHNHITECKMTIPDVERVILDVTHGVVSLELDEDAMFYDLPLSIPPK